MNIKSNPILVFTLILIISMLACNTPVAPKVTLTPPSGSGPGTVTLTNTSPILPPPAIATLRVAYVKADNIWLWTEGSLPSQMTTAGGASAPDLSGDGLEIAFLRNGEMWVVNSDGSGERNLVSTSFLAGLESGGNSVVINNHVWQPGSHVIYFNTLVIAAEVGYHIPQLDLYRSNADVGSDSVDTLEVAGSGGIPYFSPDGTKMALAQPDKIIFRDVAGGGRTIALTFPMVMTYSEWSYIPELTWSLDGSGVRVIVPAADPLGDPAAVTTVWNIPITGSATQLDTFVAIPGYASTPELSPDGSKALYLAEMGGNNYIHVRVLGGLDTSFTMGDPGQIGIGPWSPDSSRFIYWYPNKSTTYFGELGIPSSNVSDTSSNASHVAWIDASRVIFIGDSGDLRVRSFGSSSSLIDTGVTEFDAGRWVH